MKPHIFLNVICIQSTWFLLFGIHNTSNMVSIYINTITFFITDVCWLSLSSNICCVCWGIPWLTETIPGWIQDEASEHCLWMDHRLFMILFMINILLFQYCVHCITFHMAVKPINTLVKYQRNDIQDKHICEQ